MHETISRIIFRIVYTSYCRDSNLRFVYVSLKVGRVIAAMLGEVFNLTRRDIPRIPCRLYWSRFARYCMTTRAHIYTFDTYMHTRMQKYRIQSQAKAGGLSDRDG